MSNVRIAICQFDSHPPETGERENTRANFEKLRRFVSEAASQSADLIVFPEYFITGVVADHPHLASEEGHWLEQIQEIAREYSIDIVAGSIVEKNAARWDDKLYNTSYYICRTGEVLGSYRKKNLWHPEKDYLTASRDDHLVFETPKFRAGLLICWDLAWPEAFRQLMKQKVDVVIVPTCWYATDIGPIGLEHDPEGTAEASFVDSLVIARAYENECCVVFVNCGGKKEDGFLGRSAIALPLKGALARIEGCEEAMKVVDVDLSVLPVARKVYQMRADWHEKAPGWQHNDARSAE